jgi:hypothetical protein
MPWREGTLTPCFEGRADTDGLGVGYIHGVDKAGHIIGIRVEHGNNDLITPMGVENVEFGLLPLKQGAVDDYGPIPIFLAIAQLMCGTWRCLKSVLVCIGVSRGLSVPGRVDSSSYRTEEPGLPLIRR